MEHAYISSPLYALGYPTNIICNYTIIMDRSRSLKAAIRFEDVDIEDSEYCDKDSLSIYDGKNASAILLDRICGSNRDRYYMASGGTLFVQFKSNHVVTRRGFQAWPFYCYGFYPGMLSFSTFNHVVRPNFS